MSASQKNWWFLDKKGKTIGPKTISDLKRLYASKKITDRTSIWNGTSVNAWTPIKDTDNKVYREFNPDAANQRSKANAMSRSRSLLNRVTSPRTFHKTKNKKSKSSQNIHDEKNKKHKTKHRHSSSKSRQKSGSSSKKKSRSSHHTKLNSKNRAVSTEHSLSLTNPFHKENMNKDDIHSVHDDHDHDDGQNAVILPLTRSSTTPSNKASGGGHHHHHHKDKRKRGKSPVRSVTDAQKEKKKKQQSLTVLTQPVLRIHRHRGSSGASTQSIASSVVSGNGISSSMQSADGHLHPHSYTNLQQSALSQSQSSQSNQNQQLFSSVTGDDIDSILDEIEINEKKHKSRSKDISQRSSLSREHEVDHDQPLFMTKLHHSKSTPTLFENRQSSRDLMDDDDEELSKVSSFTTNSSSKLLPFAVRSNIDINWDQLTAIKFRDQNIHSIRKILGSKNVDINTKNPRDGTTLLMHAIIIGDLALVQDILRFGASIYIKDNDGDDAIDYALIFQRYKMTELLLMIRHNLTRKKLNKIINQKRTEAEYMRLNTFGKFQQNMVQFVIKAVRERQPFDINLLFLSWYFVNNGQDKITGNTPWPDPLNSSFFKVLLKAYAQILKQGRSDKVQWNWLRTQLIDSIVWLLPHPTNHEIDTLVAEHCDEDTDDDDTDVSEEMLIAQSRNIDELSDVDDQSFNALAFKYKASTKQSSYRRMKLMQSSSSSSSHKKIYGDNLLLFLFL